MTSLRHNSEDEGSPRDGYLDAARECLLDVGWRRTTLTEVARRAGVSRMTIYRAWPDMPSLLSDLMTREWAAIVESSVAAIPAGRARPDVPEAMTTAVRALRANALFSRIVELDAELMLPYLLDRRGRVQDLVLEVLEAAVRAGQEAGTVRAGSPAAIARGLVLAAHGFVLSLGTMTDDEVGEAELDAELRLMLERSLQP